MERVDCVVIGAGVIGLAIARKLSAAGRDVLILEAAKAVGTGISSRNSGVIHAGLYYPANSLKAKLCVAGRDALYFYCSERNVPFRRIGKLLIATDATQLGKLDALAQQAKRNGVEDLVSLAAADVLAIEPSITCVAALLSPSTGIIDTHALMISFQADAEAEGAVVVLDTPVIGGGVTDDGILIETGGTDPIRIRSRIVINSAGLDAPGIARGLRGFRETHVPTAFYAKGSYFGLSGPRAPFNRLIYPIPDEAGLGVHVTLDLAGRARFGPDVEWVAHAGYAVDPGRAASFYTAVRQYWPDLPDGALTPDYAGIRPKVVGPGDSSADFVIQGPRVHGVPGLINLFGIESPGITASLAIAEAVYDQLK